MYERCYLFDLCKVRTNIFSPKPLLFFLLLDICFLSRPNVVFDCTLSIACCWCLLLLGARYHSSVDDDLASQHARR
jgi:hypothetical protein